MNDLVKNCGTVVHERNLIYCSAVTNEEMKNYSLGVVIDRKSVV